MKESDIRGFLDGNVDAAWLSRALEDDASATELVAEILWDWAMPEDEAPPTTEAVKACRQRLAEA